MYEIDIWKAKIGFDKTVDDKGLHSGLSDPGDKECRFPSELNRDSDEKQVKDRDSRIPEYVQ